MVIYVPMIANESHEDDFAPYYFEGYTSREEVELLFPDVEIIEVNTHAFDPRNN